MYIYICSSSSTIFMSYFTTASSTLPRYHSAYSSLERKESDLSFGWQRASEPTTPTVATIASDRQPATPAVARDARGPTRSSSDPPAGGATSSTSNARSDRNDRRKKRHKKRPLSWAADVSRYLIVLLFEKALFSRRSHHHRIPSSSHAHASHLAVAWCSISSAQLALHYKLLFSWRRLQSIKPLHKLWQRPRSDRHSKRERRERSRATFGNCSPQLAAEHR